MLDEDNELTIARFMKGLSPSIANKMKLRPCLSLDDVCNLTIKIERQLKGRNPFKPPYQIDPKVGPRVSVPTIRLTLPLPLSKPLTKVMGVLVTLLRG